MLYEVFGGQIFRLLLSLSDPTCDLVQKHVKFREIILLFLSWMSSQYFSSDLDFVAFSDLNVAVLRLGDLMTQQRGKRK